MIKRLFCMFVPGLLMLASCAGGRQAELKIPLEEGEKVWGGFVADGPAMPFKDGFKRSLTENLDNQGQALLLTDRGRYVWSDKSFTFSVEGDRIVITDALAEVKTGRAGECLADAYGFVSREFFPADGELPPVEFFTSPQYNTWIELMYDQNQEGVLKYAEGILKNGLPPGIIMIDDTWQQDYGKWDFDPAKFPDPKTMVDKLHKMGFKVMLWICPFVSMDQYLICHEIESFKGFLLSDEGGARNWDEATMPRPTRWWNGTSAVLDLSNEKSMEWFKGRLDYLMDTYGVDGFKFDAGDYRYYPENAFSKGGLSGNEQCALFASLGLEYKYNEYRAGWQMAGRPLVQRLRDKAHSWGDLSALIPEMLAENMLGYAFSCPDMVGGGSFATFLKGEIDQDLIVRSAQCHALMTMMQFSLAPWRVLDKEHYSAVLKAVRMRKDVMPLIMSLAEEAAATGAPVIRPLEFVFPHQGYGCVKDQFMLGDSFMVAPMVYKGFERSVELPEGVWTADDGTVYESPSGGMTITVDVPLDRIPCFRLGSK